MNKNNCCPDISPLVKVFIKMGYKPWDINTKSKLDFSGTLYITLHLSSINVYYIGYLKNTFFEWTLLDVLWIHDDAQSLFQ